MNATIYKLVPRPLWRQAEETGTFTGSPVDHQDGYIHFSTAGQVEETAAKHFAGQRDLLIVAVDAGALGGRLKYEPSRSGALFPHLYEPLGLQFVRWVKEVPLPETGRHLFPSLEP